MDWVRDPITVILAKAGIPLLPSLRAKEGSGIPCEACGTVWGTVPSSHFAGMTGKGR